MEIYLAWEIISHYDKKDKKKTKSKASGGNIPLPLSFHLKKIF